MATPLPYLVGVGHSIEPPPLGNIRWGLKGSEIPLEPLLMPARNSGSIFLLQGPIYTLFKKLKDVTSDATPPIFLQLNYSKPTLQFFPVKCVFNTVQNGSTLTANKKAVFENKHPRHFKQPGLFGNNEHAHIIAACMF